MATLAPRQRQLLFHRLTLFLRCLTVVAGVVLKLASRDARRSARGRACARAMSGGRYAKASAPPRSAAAHAGCQGRRQLCGSPPRQAHQRGRRGPPMSRTARAPEKLSLFAHGVRLLLLGCIHFDHQENSSRRSRSRSAASPISAMSSHCCASVRYMALSASSPRHPAALATRTHSAALALQAFARVELLPKQLIKQQGNKPNNPYGRPRDARKRTTVAAHAPIIFLVNRSKRAPRLRYPADVPNTKKRCPVGMCNRECRVNRVSPNLAAGGAAQ